MVRYFFSNVCIDLVQCLYFSTAKVYVFRYSDNACQNVIESHSYFTGCAISVDSYYATSVFSESLQYQAGNGDSSGDMPIPWGPVYATET